MQACVVLPDDLLFECSRFCTWIAQALVPAGEQGLRGIACIVGKRIDCTPVRRTSGAAGSRSSHGPQPDLLGGQLGHLMVSPKPNGLFLAPWDDPSQMTLADDGYARDQLQITELSLQYPLTDDDRRFLESVLPHLPPLHYPMSEAGAKDFLDAWCSLPNRPEWEPVWVTAASIERRKAEQDAAMRRHLQALEGDFAQGLLAAVNSERIEVVALSRSCLIPREQAIAYLNRHGIRYRHQETGDDTPGAKTARSEQRPEVPNCKQSAVGNSKLSPEQREQLVHYHEQLEKDGVKDPTMQTMKKFDVSDSYVRQLVRKAKARASLEKGFPRPGKGK